MESLATDKDVVFIGYNVHGNMFSNILEDQLIEMPVAENLMMSVAIGMALEGYKPVVYFERMDFVTNAMDSIVNHLDKIKEISHGEFDPQVMIRCVVGNIENPLYTGLTHTQNLSEGIRSMVSFPVIELKDKKEIENQYKEFETKILVEFKDKYNE